MYISIYRCNMYASIIGWGGVIQHTLALTGQTCIYVVWVDGTDRQTQGMGGWVDCRNGWMGGRQMANHRGEYIPYIPCLNCYNTYML